MEALKIIATFVGAAIVYGIVHDQITARVCVEYFTIGHPPVFNTESPTLLAFGWGTIATWWAGLLCGLPAALLARFGSGAKLTAVDFRRPIVVLFGVMAVCSLVAGVSGYYAATDGRLRLLDDSIAVQLSPERRILFLADLCAHQAAYGIGFLGGIVICFWIVFRRFKLETAARHSQR